MSCRKFVWGSLIGIFSLLFISGMVVFIADPFYHYHKPWFEMPVVLYNEVYQTPGVAENFEYDSAIVGSSMTENFRVSWFNEDFGWNTVKLSYEGAGTDDLKAILTEVFEEERQVKNIVLAVDDYQMVSDSSLKAIDRPEYLYNDNIFDDVNYLFNKEAFEVSLERIADGIRGCKADIDSAYNFSSKYEFSKEQVLKDAAPFKANITAYPPKEKAPKDKYLQQCKDNLDNILPFIEENPDTQFMIVYSPYSILNWEKKVLAGTLEAQIYVDAYAIEQFLSYENVRVFYFQDEYDMITDLDKYMDTCHYVEEYNHYIEQCLKSGKNEVTDENYEERLKNMYEIAVSYDYEAEWE